MGSRLKLLPPGLFLGYHKRSQPQDSFRSRRQSRPRITLLSPWRNIVFASRDTGPSRPRRWVYELHSISSVDHFLHQHQPQYRAVLASQYTASRFASPFVRLSEDTRYPQETSQTCVPTLSQPSWPAVPSPLLALKASTLEPSTRPARSLHPPSPLSMLRRQLLSFPTSPRLPLLRSLPLFRPTHPTPRSTSSATTALAPRNPIRMTRRRTSWPTRTTLMQPMPPARLRLDTPCPSRI